MAITNQERVGKALVHRQGACLWFGHNRPQKKVALVASLAELKADRLRPVG